VTDLLDAARTRFTLPEELSASAPPEARGLRRDRVRLLVATGGALWHTRFDQLPRFLCPGDLLVVNNSATLAAAVDGTLAGGHPVTVHFSGPDRLADGDRSRWVVEPRHPDQSGPVRGLAAGAVVRLPGGGALALVDELDGGGRLWRARLTGTAGRQPADVLAYLFDHGRPIGYGYLRGRWPLDMYQTVFATEPGSAEMPSAGRPFSAELVTALVTAGIGVAPVTLHTGVSSQEAGEPPQPERFEVPGHTAAQVNLARERGNRVVAVGTTVARTLETVARPDGRVEAGAGWTDLVLGPGRPVRAVDGLVTGFHAPEASHLLLLEAIAGTGLVQRAYDAALAHRYLWHEFGDGCLLLPDRRRPAGQPATLRS
jgi:S-adenosylmethionine:tRNA ribosyltransferase-isomerase